MTNSATSKLELGLERLAKAGTDADLLGLALQSLHGALEDAFRAQLAADAHVPPAQRADMPDPKKIQWKDLLDAMVLYRDLSQTDRDTIWRMNGVRTRVAHGGRYTGTRAELETYAALVQRLGGYPGPAAKPAAKPQAAATATPAAKARATPPAAPDIPRAVRSRSPAPPARSRMSWLIIVSVTALLGVLALAAIVRNATSTSAPTPSPPVPTAADVAEATTQPPAATTLPHSAHVRATGGLRLRADHSTAAEILLTLGDGTQVTIIGGPVAGEGYTWWQVEAGERSGWCAGDFLQFEQ